MIDALLQADLRLSQWVVSRVGQSDFGMGISLILAEVLIVFCFMPLVYLWFKPQPVSARHGNKKAVMLALLSVVFCLALKVILSALWFRARPFVADPSLLLFPLSVDPASFPSAHAMLAFTVGASFWFSGVKQLGGWLLLLALLIAMGRVMVGVHFPLDVLAGAIFGAGVAYLLHRESSSIKQYLPN